MLALALLAAAAYLIMAAVELPGLWGRRHRRGELWAAAVLILLGLVVAIAVTLGLRPPSAWRLIEAVWRPVGDLLLRPKGG